MGEAAAAEEIEVPITTLRALEAPEVVEQLRQGASSVCLITLDGQNDLALALVGSPISQLPWIVTAALEHEDAALWRKVLLQLPRVVQLAGTSGPVSVEKRARPLAPMWAAASFHPSSGESPPVVAFCVHGINLWPLPCGAVAFVHLSPTVCSALAAGFGLLEAPSSVDPVFLQWALRR